MRAVEAARAAANRQAAIHRQRHLKAKREAIRGQLKHQQKEAERLREVVEKREGEAR